MKYGIDILTNERIEPGLQSKAKCQCCDSELIPKCGKIRLHYWAHKSITNCDPWWESETEWHRKWKDRFPISWQESIKQDVSTNEKHIADIYNPKLDLVIEFQNSPISSEELQSRELFYKRMIWVLNGNKFNIDISVLCNSDSIEDRIKRKVKKEMNELSLKTEEILIKKISEVKRIEKDIRNNRIHDITGRTQIKKLEEEIYHKRIILYDEPIILLKKRINNYHNTIRKFEILNSKRPKDEWYEAYNWKYKSSIWENNQCPIFIDISKELYLVKNEYILQAVPMNKFLNKYSTE